MNRQTRRGNHAFACERRVVRIVDVAEHGFDGRDFLQRFEHPPPADIPGMEDEIDVLEHVCDFRPHEAVGVGNDSDDHGVCAVCSAASRR